MPPYRLDTLSHALTDLAFDIKVGPIIHTVTLDTVKCKSDPDTHTITINANASSYNPINREASHVHSSSIFQPDPYYDPSKTDLDDIFIDLIIKSIVSLIFIELKQVDNKRKMKNRVQIIADEISGRQ